MVFLMEKVLNIQVYKLYLVGALVVRALLILKMIPATVSIKQILMTHKYKNKDFGLMVNKMVPSILLQA